MHWRMQKFPIRSHNWTCPCHVPVRRRNPSLDFRNPMTFQVLKAVYQHAALSDQLVYHARIHVITRSLVVAQTACIRLTMSQSRHVFDSCLSA